MASVHGAQKEIRTQHTTPRNPASNTQQNKVGSISTTTPFFKERKKAIQSRGLKLLKGVFPVFQGSFLRGESG
jgi:hypothetical protein